MDVPSPQFQQEIVEVLQIMDECTEEQSVDIPVLQCKWLLAPAVPVSAQPSNEVDQSRSSILFGRERPSRWWTSLAAGEVMEDLVQQRLVEPMMEEHKVSSKDQILQSARELSRGSWAADYRTVGGCAKDSLHDRNPAADCRANHRHSGSAGGGGDQFRFFSGRSSTTFC